MNFVTKSVVSISGTGLRSVITLLTGIFLARWLLPAGIGQYQLIVTTMLIIGGIATLGVGQATIFYINRKKVDVSIVATVAFKFSLVMGSVTFFIALAVLCYRPYFGEIPFWVIFICGIQGVALTLVASLYPVLIALLQIKKYILVQLTPCVILFLLVITGMLLGVMNINYAWAALSIGQVCGALMVLWFLWKWISFRTPFEWGLFKSLVVYGAKLNLTYMIHILNGEIGILLLRYFLPNDFTEIGYYSRAIRLGGILLVLSGSLSPLFYSKWSSIKSTERGPQVERVSRVFWSLFLLLIGILELSAGYLIIFLYKSPFLPAVPIMRILLIGIGARFLSAPLFSLFSGSGKPLFTSFVLGINLVIMIILMVFLVPIYMGVGAAIAFTLSNLAGLVIAYSLSCRKFGIRFSQCIFMTGSDIKYFVRALRL